jgi:hypothetical protein
MNQGGGGRRKALSGGSESDLGLKEVRGRAGVGGPEGEGESASLLAWVIAL